MTYAGFLLRFVIIPIVLLSVLLIIQRRKSAAVEHASIAPRYLLLALAVIALIYTTPWDNYLVANGIWWYDPSLVLGVRLGWVPLEEYAFFILQPALTGLWFLLLARRAAPSTSFTPQSDIRYLGTAVLGIVWLASLAILLVGWKPGTYLSLILVWALPPVALQVMLGGDILWHYRRVVFLTVATATLYLSAADLLAIGSGTWTINPERSLGILIGGILPLEEMIFFLLTNVLLVFGLTLGLARESLDRLPKRFTSQVFTTKPHMPERSME